MGHGDWHPGQKITSHLGSTKRDSLRLCCCNGEGRKEHRTTRCHFVTNFKKASTVGC